ncbi:MAG: hypothetical protein SW833_13355 [Cyanobacteriota bacterium]|nr:hypothetical protein [Cyanobacteriota bacterium]
MNSSSSQRQQIIEAIEGFPDELITELTSFVNYLRYKSTQTRPQKSGKDFLLTVAGLGASTECDVSERDENILASEIDPIRGWSIHK